MSTNLFELLTYIIGEFVFYVSIHIFFSSIFKTTPLRKNIKNLLWFAGIVIISEITNLYFTSTLTNLFSSIIFTILLSLMYSRKLPSAALFSTFFQIIAIASEGIFIGLYYLFTQKNIDDLFSNAYWLGIAKITSCFIQLVITYVISIVLNHRRSSSQITQFWPIILFFSAGCIYIFSFCAELIQMYNITNYIPLLLVCIILIIFSLTIYYLYDRQCRDYILHIENNQLKNYITHQEIAQKETQKYLEETKAQRHEFNRLILLLHNYMDNKNYDEVTRLLEKNIGEYSKPANIVNTIDSTVNSLFNYKLVTANLNHIQVDYNIFLGSRINITDEDKYILFGNLFDNAIEYLSTHPYINPKIIKVLIEESNNVLLISFSNPVAENIVIPEDLIIPSSKNTALHGYGIKNIKKIVDKYEGALSITCNGNVFETTITLIN